MELDFQVSEEITGSIILTHSVLNKATPDHCQLGALIICGLFSLLSFEHWECYGSNNVFKIRQQWHYNSVHQDVVTSIYFVNIKTKCLQNSWIKTTRVLTRKV